MEKYYAPLSTEWDEGSQLIEKTTEYVLSCIVVSTTMS